jgi:hypothetical protein
MMSSMCGVHCQAFLAVWYLRENFLWHQVNFFFSCSDVSTHDLVGGSVRLSLPKGMSFPWELPKVFDNCAPWKKVDCLECASQLQAKYPNVPIQAQQMPF